MQKIELYPTAAQQNLAACDLCHKVVELTEEYCPRCRTKLHLRKPKSLSRTWGWLIASAILYIPANLIPVMKIEGIRGDQSNTIIGGVITFWQMQAYPVAIVIFVASVLIPLLKITTLIYLCITTKSKTEYSPQRLSQLYHITELLGRWSMVDVFVVAILVCLVRLGSMITITPGPAALSFAGVVVFTMFAAMSFDPRLLWDQYRKQQSL